MTALRGRTTRARQRRARVTAAEAYLLALAMYTNREDITGVDVGPKYVDGERTRKIVVRVHVKRKRAPRNLTGSELIPEFLLGVPTDVIVGNYRRHGGGAASPTERATMLRPGLSVGSSKADTGTLGLVVYDEETGAPCLLGAHHVFAGPHAAEGDVITQPGRFDGGLAPGDAVATLFRILEPGHWGDGAVARLTNARLPAPEILGSNARIEELGEPERGLVVEKSGRTTGVTTGKIEALGTYFYPEVRSGVSGFLVYPERDDPDIPDLSAPGDSGAAYYIRGTNIGVGLHCAGAVDRDRGEVGIACSLVQVMSALRVRLKPQG